MFESPFPPHIGFAGASLSELRRTADVPWMSRYKQSMSPGRFDEFRMGRLAAERAMKVFGAGVARLPVLKGESGEPVWPTRVSGSITHSAANAYAAVVSNTNCVIGLDCERLFQPREWQDVLAQCADRFETAWVMAAPGQTCLRATLLFSAKEALFKAVYPRIRKYFGFSDVTIEWSDTDRHFVPVRWPQYLSAVGCAKTTGIKCRVAGDYVLTSYFHEFRD